MSNEHDNDGVLLPFLFCGSNGASTVLDLIEQLSHAEFSEMSKPSLPQSSEEDLVFSNFLKNFDNSIYHSRIRFRVINEI